MVRSRKSLLRFHRRWRSLAAAALVPSGLCGLAAGTVEHKLWWCPSFTVDREANCGSDFVCAAREATFDDPDHSFCTSCLFDQAAQPTLAAVGTARVAVGHGPAAILSRDICSRTAVASNAGGGRSQRVQWRNARKESSKLACAELSQGTSRALSVASCGRLAWPCLWHSRFTRSTPTTKTLSLACAWKTSAKNLVVATRGQGRSAGCPVEIHWVHAHRDGLEHIVVGNSCRDKLANLDREMHDVSEETCQNNARYEEHLPVANAVHWFEPGAQSPNAEPRTRHALAQFCPQGVRGTLQYLQARH